MHGFKGQSGMRFYSVVVFIFFVFLSCKSGSDILAKIDGDTVTRSEFNDWIESRNLSLKKVYNDKYAMSDYLCQIAVEKLNAAKAEKSGYNVDSKFKIIENALYMNLLADFITEKQKADPVFNEKGLDLSIIRVFFRNNNTDESLIEKENKKKLIIHILSKLKSGEDFNELAVKYSEDTLSENKGRMGILPENIIEDSILNSVSQLYENDYSKEPVQVGNSFCLIKLHKRYQLTGKNLKNIVTDQNNLERILNYYEKKSQDDLINKIYRERNVISKIDKTTFRKSNESIFSIDGDVFTSDELDIILKFFYSIKNGYPPSNEFSLNEKKLTSEKILKERLLASEAKNILLEHDKKFERNWKYLRRATLAGAYKYNILLKKLKVSDEEIRKEFNENRNKKYFRLKKIKNKDIKVFLTYQEAIPVIKNNLNRESLRSLKKAWDDRILIDGNYQIVNKDFLIN